MFKSDWFVKEFGFVEKDQSFQNIRDKMFQLQSPKDGDWKLISRKGSKKGKVWQCGTFECLSVLDLRRRLGSSRPRSKLRFEQIVGDVCSIHKDAKNNSVIQVASQLNCLEMVHPGVTPEEGITIYWCDRSQGPQAALCAPAGTLVRNYYVGKKFGAGQAAGNQINNFQHIHDMVDNGNNGWWHVKNGYLLPGDRERGIAELSRGIQNMTALASMPDLNGEMKNYTVSFQNLIKSFLKVGVQ